MDLEEAKRHVEAAPPQYLFEELRSKLAELHAEHPQRQQLANHAMNLVEEGIAQLARLGHYFHLSESAASEPEAFPKMVYRDAGSQRIVESEAELTVAKKEGWREHPAVPAVPAARTVPRKE